MTRTSVGILRGGTSSEYDLSLQTGATMMAALPEEKYETRDILIDRNGLWHLRGTPSTPSRALSQVDVVLNALHGGVGEDGTVQRILDRAGVPYAGSRALSASVSLNKIRAREVLHGAGILIPRGVALRTDKRMSTDDMAKAIFLRFGPPYVVKPACEGSSHGLRIAKTVIDLPDVIGNTLDEYGSALVEEYLVGAHATVVLVEHFRHEPLYVFPSAHTDFPKGVMYFDPKNESVSSRYIVPSRFPQDIKVKIANVARKAHVTLKLAHYSDADFVITRRGPILLEVNALPGLHECSAFPNMLEAVGSSIREFLEHLIMLARKGI